MLPAADDHLSRTPVSRRLQQPTRNCGDFAPGNEQSPEPPCGGSSFLLGLAPGGGCPAAPLLEAPVGSYPAISPLPVLRPAVCFCGPVPQLSLQASPPPRMF